MNINEIVDTKLLHEMIDGGYVEVIKHKSEPIMLLNATSKAFEEGVYNDAIINCRGLLVNTDTGEIVARPFPQFLDADNLHSVDRTLMVGPIHVTDLLDGTLGITYWAPNAKKWAIATQAGFDTKEADWATKYLHNKLMPQGVGTSDGPTEQTALVEIIYPANRKVVDYNQRESMPLLAIIEHDTGRNVLPDLQNEKGTRINWPDGTVEEFPFETLDEVLAADPRENAAGYVVHYLFSDLRIRVRYDSYVAAHKLIKGMSERSIWEVLSKGGSVDALVAALPNDKKEWVKSVAERLTTEVAQTTFTWGGELATVLKELNVEDPETYLATPEGRKAFAEKAKKHDDPDPLFALLDGKNIEKLAWERVKPEAQPVS